MFRRGSMPLGAASLLACLAALVAARGAAAISFAVDSTADAVDAALGDGSCATSSGACTLRAAIQETNALAGADELTLPAGIYALAIAGGEEDAAATGDLDVRGPLTINGGGAATTIIDGNGIGRVLDTAFATVAISGVTIRGGDAFPEESCAGLHLAVGGGICGPVTLTESVVEGNRAEYGGGLFGGGLLERVTVRDNQATLIGGGLMNLGGATLIDTTVSGNAGGGLFFAYGGTATLHNVTISGNDGTGLSAVGGCGELPECVDATLVTMNNVTVTGNDGGISTGYFYSYPFGEPAPTATISNTILADNGNDCWGAFTSQGHNLVQSPGCTIDGDLTGNLTDVGAKLGPLADNGGPTLTHALLPFSPALGAGNPAAPGSHAYACELADQRGVVRPIGAACEIGAFESPCGNGVVDPGETCDDGNPVDGDGCDSNCTPTDCGNAIVTAGEDCDDGNLADGDCCSAACRFDEPSQACDDDGNECTTEACDGAGRCEHSPTTGGPCDDGDACSEGDTCQAGACVPATAGCHPCETCQPGVGCIVPVAPACAAAAPRGSYLLLEDRIGAERDRLVWQWTNAVTVKKSDLGFPSIATGFGLCLFDATGGVFIAGPGAGCTLGACWEEIPTGWRYFDPDLKIYPVKRIVLVSGAPRKARFRFQAKGPLLDLPPLPLLPPVRAKFYRTDNGQCWEAIYTENTASEPAKRFRARSD